MGPASPVKLAICALIYIENRRLRFQNGHYYGL
uniref:Uncharacterized protein n=1 Tax=Anguilla anguilla TaxID=7936 RepID=A0A0E9USX9_ANGAN